MHMGTAFQAHLLPVDTLKANMTSFGGVAKTRKVVKLYMVTFFSHTCSRSVVQNNLIVSVCIVLL